MPQLRPPTGGVGAGAVPSSQACLTGGLQLPPLDRQDVVAMVASCLGSPAVPERSWSSRRADGVPFMVEELLGAALWSGALVAKAESWRVRERAESMVPRRRRAGGVGG